MTGNASDEAEAKLLALLAGKWLTAAVSAAAELGLADVLHERPMTPAELAERLGCDPDGLARLLRVLSGEALVELDVHGTYALTPLGAKLRSGQLRELARLIGAPFMWSPWAQMADALRHRTTAFEATHGQSLFAYLDEHEEDARLYHAAVDAFTRREARALAEAFDFGSVSAVVDVGGGLGTLLVEVAARYPALHCVLYDRPAVIERAQSSRAAQRLRERLQLVAGDFFERVPAGGDVYVVKHVLHNWDDRHAIRLLEHCARAVNPGGHVLIVESILLPGNRRDGARLLDLEMLVLCGPGRERRKPELRALLQRAGLKLLSSHDLAGTARLLVASPKTE